MAGLRRSTLLTLLTLAPVAGCDADELLDDAEVELRSTPVGGGLGLKPYHGRWEGPMASVSGNSSLAYDATIILAPGICTVSGVDVYKAEWDYYNLGQTCTSELDLLGMGVGPGGIRTWTFYDHNLTGPCIDGLVDLTETADPAIMDHTWRYPDGTLDATGEVHRVGTCGSGSGGGGGGG